MKRPETITGKSGVSNPGSFLRITLLSGLILLLLCGAAFGVFYFFERSSSRVERQMESFSRILDEVDTYLNEFAGTGREVELLNRQLDRLEKMAISVESWLSILKRRRALAQIDPRSGSTSLENYHKSIDSALQAYPMSQHIAAVAAAALIKDTAITMETEQKLRRWLPLFTDPLFNDFRLSLHTLLGDFRNPQRAAQIPSTLASDGTQAITANLIILKILRNDLRGAAADIQTIVNSTFLSDNLLRLAGEYYYDFGDLSRSAEIFSRINDEKALIRQADALYLAGFFNSARAIWSILADSAEAYERSLYNLGVTAENPNEAIGYFERLINSENTANNAGRQFGIIRYSRLLDTPQAIALLATALPFEPHPYIDLELCRRQSPNWELGRQIAEAWLLLDRHPDSEELYRWAAWLFLFQRNYSEIKILLSRMENLQITSQWAKVSHAIQLMFEGDLDAAEKILLSIPADEAGWPVFANLGRIMEARRSPSRALEQYELAASKKPSPKPAAIIQLRMARCFSALGRSSEALRALLYAVELDPGNLTARLELDRLFH